MGKLIRSSDRVKVKIHDMVFHIKPLTQREKMLVMPIMQKAAQAVKEIEAGNYENLSSASEAATLTLKLSLKKVEGLFYEDEDGNDVEYTLSFDEDGTLSEECVDDLMNLEQSTKLMTVVGSMVQGFSGNEFTDGNGKKLEGVSLVKKQPAKKQLKRSSK